MTKWKPSHLTPLCSSLNHTAELEGVVLVSQQNWRNTVVTSTENWTALQMLDSVTKHTGVIYCQNVTLFHGTRVPVIVFMSIKKSTALSVVTFRKLTNSPKQRVWSPASVKKYKNSSCTVPVILVWFKENFNFLHVFSKNSQIPNFIKIHPAAAELSMRAGRRAHTAWLIVACRKYCERA